MPRKAKAKAKAESFDVEKIVGKRYEGGRNEYRVRWKGFAEGDDTWEPVANLDSAGVAIKAYEQSQASSDQLRPGDVVEVDRKFAVGDGGRGTIVSEDAEGNYVVKYAGGGPQEKGVPLAALTRPDASASEESGGRRSRRSSIAEPKARPTASPAISPPASATSTSPPTTGTESKPLKISSARARIGQSVEVCRRDFPALFERCKLNGLCCGQVEFQGLGCFMGKVTGVKKRSFMVHFDCDGTDAEVVIGKHRYRICRSLAEVAERSPR